MRISSDTGEAILNEVEQYDADLAADDLNGIAIIMGEFWGLIEVMRGKIQMRSLMERTEAQLNYMAEGIQEQLREFLGDDWTRLTKNAHREWLLEDVPERTYIADPNAEKYYPYKKREVFTNPATHEVLGKPL